VDLSQKVLRVKYNELMEEFRTLKERELAEAFRYSLRNWQRLRKAGVAPVMPIPGTTRYSKALVDSIIDAEDQVKAVAARLSK